MGGLSDNLMILAILTSSPGSFLSHVNQAGARLPEGQKVRWLFKKRIVAW
jgi:hypothetical protein